MGTSINDEVTRPVSSERCQKRPDVQSSMPDIRIFSKLVPCASQIIYVEILTIKLSCLKFDIFLKHFKEFYFFKKNCLIALM